MVDYVQGVRSTRLHQVIYLMLVPIESAIPLRLAPWWTAARKSPEGCWPLRPRDDLIIYSVVTPYSCNQAALGQWLDTRLPRHRRKRQ